MKQERSPGLKDHKWTTDWKESRMSLRYSFCGDREKGGRGENPRSCHVQNGKVGSGKTEGLPIRKNKNTVLGKKEKVGRSPFLAVDSMDTSPRRRKNAHFLNF